MKERTRRVLLTVLPKNHLSAVMGRLMETPWPKTLTQVSLRWFVRKYKINLSEAEKPLSAYPRISDFFTRRLKLGSRPIEGDLVHPCDGALIQAGTIKRGRLIQAKGKTYSLAELLASESEAKYFADGCFLTYYLCPADYHRVHFPASGQIYGATHVPGTLWPVDAASVQRISNLYCQNERVITRMETDRGRATVVMVGATNVGKISLAFDAKVVGNRLSKRMSVRRGADRAYSPPLSAEVGQELGVFHLGSTVILLLQKGMLSRNVSLGPVKMGQRLGP